MLKESEEMMFSKQLEELEMISQAVGNSPDLVQGGGGNTSVKLDDKRMAVKASGFKLKDITPTEGFVVVHYQNIRKYYEQVDITEEKDFEKESSQYVRENIVPMEGIESLRPSVEAGFHSLLEKYVIHSHSVYANMVCCSKNGRALADEIFHDARFGRIWIPYINPGFSLTLAIKKEISQYISVHHQFPQVIFMENHGLVVTAESAFECIELHKEVNAAILGHLKNTEPFPSIKIKRIEESMFAGDTTYLKDYFKERDVSLSFFENTILYPDQLVYLNENVSLNEQTNKLNINTSTGEILYKTNEKEALTMEETLAAFIFVVENIQRNNLTLKTMNQKEIDFIRNWESEKYRKTLLNDKK